MATKKEQKTTREKLITTINAYAGDELGDRDWMEIAAESEEELIDRVISILNYYYEQSND